MVVTGRLIGRVDSRMLILTGLLLTAFSLHWMAGFTTEVPMSTLVWTGVVQGFGLGFIFVPLSPLTFATLAPHYRHEGTAMYSLMRNIGASIGISAVIPLLAHKTQVPHAYMAHRITQFLDLRHLPRLPSPPAGP